jgi:membrane protease YdiL (CAAX protease family)
MKKIIYKKLLFFIAITYSITLIFHVVLQLIGGNDNPISMNLIGIPMIFPFLSVIVVEKLIFKESIKSRFNISFKLNRVLVLSILIPIIMSVIINGFAIILFNKSLVVTSQILNAFILNIILGLTIATISAFFEEFAWRGFMYDNLEYLGILKSSVVIGIAWSLWHIPVVIWYKYSLSPITGVLINFIQMFLLSIIISYIFYMGKNIMSAAILHGMINTMFLSTSSILFNVGEGLRVDILRIFISLFVVLILILADILNRKDKLKVLVELDEN